MTVPNTDTAPAAASTDVLNNGTLGQQVDAANPAPAPAAPQTPAAPAKPSLWKGVLAGALQGLAAGSQVNTRGMNKAEAFGVGAGAGANQVLNKVPAQNAELDQAKLTTAIHYANLSKIMRDIHTAPQTRQEQILSDAADDASAMLKSGAIVPLSEPSDAISAQKKVQELHAAQPWAVYSVSPVKGSDGTIKYAAVQFAKAPTQTDVTLKGEDGQSFTIPAGTAGEDAGKLYSTWKAKQLDATNKKALETQKEGARADLEDKKQAGRIQIQDMKNTAAAAKGSNKPADMVFGTTSDGRQIAGSQDELKAAGVASPVKLPGTEAQKVVVARQLIGPRKGLFDMVNNDIDQLAKAGKLGVVASRWGEFMAGKVGDDPEFQALRTHMGLLSTALMQAHVGARGSKDMLQHFKELANYSISNEPTLRKALQSEWEYVNEKAMLPDKNPAAGRSGPGQAAPTAPAGAAPLSFADWKNSQKGK